MTWLPGVAGAYFSATALNSWLAKLLVSTSQMTVIEHNSGVAYIAMLKDWMAGPAEVVAAGASAYRWVDLYGSQIAPNLAAGTSTQRVPLYGVLPDPTDVQRKLYTDALSDVLERLDYHDSTTATIVANAIPNDAIWVGITGDAAMVTYESWEYTPNTVIQEPANLAALIPNILLAAVTFGIRLQAQARGDTTTSATLISAIEQTMQPGIQALADSVRAADTSAVQVAAGTVAGGIALTLGIGLIKPKLRKVR